MIKEKEIEIFSTENVLEHMIVTINHAFLNVCIETNIDRTYVGPRIAEKISGVFLDYLVNNHRGEYSNAQFSFLIGVRRHFILNAEKLANSVSSGIENELKSTGIGRKDVMTSGGDEEMY